MNTFKIFIKADKFVFTRARISFGLFCLILIFACCIEKKNYPQIIHSITLYSFISLLIFGIINRQLKRKLEGDLKFNFDNITNNELIVILDTGEILKTYFQRKYENEIMFVHESLKNYLDQGKLSRKNYDEITQ